MDIATFSYIDEDIVDEIWMLARREGIKEEKLEKIKADVQAKVNFSLGTILSKMIGELKGELMTQGGVEFTNKTTYGSALRLMILQEFLSLPKPVWQSEHDVLGQFKPGSFIDVQCEKLTIAPLPRLGDYWNVTLSEQLSENERSETTKEKAEAALRIIDKFSSHHRAITFYSSLRAVGEGTEDEELAKDCAPLTRLASDYPDVFLEMMRLSDNDLILGAALSLRKSSPNPTLERWIEVKQKEVAEENTLATTPSSDRRALGFFSIGTGKKLSEEEAEAERKEDEKIKARALEAVNANSDTIIVTCFKDGNLRRNVAALSWSGKMRLFGRVLTNKLETRTRLITVQPIALSIAT